MKVKMRTRIVVGLLCGVLNFSGITLYAGEAGEALRHEAFMRGGDAIAAALTAPATPAPVTAIVIPPAPAPVPPPAPRPQSSGQSRMSKGMWGLLIGGFVVSGAIVYWAATGQGASVRNCSTCSK